MRKLFSLLSIFSFLVLTYSCSSDIDSTDETHPSTRAAKPKTYSLYSTGAPTCYANDRNESGCYNDVIIEFSEPLKATAWIFVEVWDKKGPILHAFPTVIVKAGETRATITFSCSPDDLVQTIPCPGPGFVTKDLTVKVYNARYSNSSINGDFDYTPTTQNTATITIFKNCGIGDGNIPGPGKPKDGNDDGGLRG